jgi:hypothetical protein
MMGTVGLPLPGIDMRLEAVPELGYDPNDAKAPRGEVGGVVGVDVGKLEGWQVQAEPRLTASMLLCPCVSVSMCAAVHTRTRAGVPAWPHHVPRLLQAARDDGRGSRRRGLVPHRC